MKSFIKIFISFVLILSISSCALSCNNYNGIINSDRQENTGNNTSQFYINGENRYILAPGDSITLTLTIPEGYDGVIEWTSSHSCVTVDNGVINVISYGTSVVKATLGEYSDSVIILVPGLSTDRNTDNDIVTDSTDNNDNIQDSDFSDINTDSSFTDNSNVQNDSSDIFNDTVTDENTDVTTDNTDTENDFAFGYDTISISEALELAKQHVSSSSYEKYYVVGTVKEINSAKNGRMYIYDKTGTIYVYKSTMVDGTKVSESSLSKGDIVLICGTLRNYNGTLEIDVGTIIDFYKPNEPLDKNDPYANVDVNEFYANYKPATSYEDAYYRTLHNLMSGTIGLQDQAPTISLYQPKLNDKFVRNTDMVYSEDGNTYYVVDAHGDIVMEIYKGAAYIMLEEVAAYVFAFGEPPANQTSSKNTSPSSSDWGEYLRLNHTSFSGSTKSFPYEPKLPNISGCGGTLNYYEMDIGTTGTDCDPSYIAEIYNDGYTITRGAARIVYVCEDDDGNGVIDYDERYVFYTYNHYNDFQEYLNYYGGWGEMFGNITGGGTISSKTDYNPTPYVYTEYASFSNEAATVNIVIYCDIRKYFYCYL